MFDLGKNGGGMKLGIGEEIEEISENVRSLEERRIEKIEDEKERNNKFKMNIWSEFGEIGVIGIKEKEEYGGEGMGYIENWIEMEEIRSD